MRHLDLSYEGRQLAERNQPNNGVLPHGGYRGGSRKYPPCHLSHDKGREFQHKIQDEIDRLLEDNEIALKGTSPSWALLVSREPSYTDESPLITNSFISPSKLVPSNGVSLSNRSSLLPTKKSVKQPKRQAVQYYRPNSTHQYLSATELKNCSEDEVNVQHGRPTRTTLLRARQRCSSAPMNSYDKKRESETRLDDQYRTSQSASSNKDFLHLDKDGETLHSFLTGARYNRAHCLDSRSVDHTGVYMPRHNPALGCFFTGPKGHEYLKEFEDTPRSNIPTPPSSHRTRRRPTTAPSYGRRVANHPPPTRVAWAEISSHHPRHKQARLNIVGTGIRLPLGGHFGTSRYTNNVDEAVKLPILQGRSLTSPRRQPAMMVDSYRAFQPPPTPTSIAQPSTAKTEADVIVAANDFRSSEEDEGQRMNTKPSSPSVNVPKMKEGNLVDKIHVDENCINPGDVSQEESDFAAATVATAIAAAVQEISMSAQAQKVKEGEEGRQNETGIENDDKEDNDHTEELLKDDNADDIDKEKESKPVVKGVRFFITEKTTEKKEDVEDENGGEQIEDENVEGVSDGGLETEIDREQDIVDEEGEGEPSEYVEEENVNVDCEDEEKSEIIITTEAEENNNLTDEETRMRIADTDNEENDNANDSGTEEEVEGEEVKESKEDQQCELLETEAENTLQT